MHRQVQTELCASVSANICLDISKWLHISPPISQQNEFLLIVHAVLASQPLYSLYFPHLHTVHIITSSVNTCRFVKYISWIHLQFLRRTFLESVLSLKAKQKMVPKKHKELLLNPQIWVS